MTMTMEDLLERQQIIAEAIFKIDTNFKKDSAKRKTEEYIQKRVTSLRALWDEFEVNHSQLLEVNDKSSDYFASNAYGATKRRYEATLKMLETFPVVNSEERGVLSKSDELLTQQTTNFRALSRLVRNVNINSITEKWHIEDKLQMLQARWKIIDEVHWQLDNLLEGTNADYEQEFSRNEALYESTKMELHRKLNNTTYQHQTLPKIELPTFSGNYSQWPAFLDLYREAIHNNMSIPKAQKMQHLKGKLKGEAERLVQHLTVSTENYDTCWEILTHRYNNKQLLFTKQIQTFMSQPAIQHQNAFELKRLHDTSMETIHAIHNLGVDTSSWDPILVHILTTKLDPETYTSYMESRKAPRDLPVFEEFIEFLEGKFTALEPLNKKKPQQHNTPRPFNGPIKESTPFVKDSQNNNNKYRSKFALKTYHASAERSCPVCKENHILIFCAQFQNMTPETKLRTISQADICKNCLYTHKDKQCSSRKRCRVCNSAHHTYLHDAFRNSEQTSATSSGQQPYNRTESNNKQSTGQQRNANHVTGNFNEVLLATVQLKVKASDGTYVILRCLLDQGSQINLITESATQRLGLQRLKQQATVSGVGFSNNHSNGTVQLECASLYGDFSFCTEALVMTKMLNNLPNYSFGKQHWPHLHNINLADPDYNVSRPVDILLDAGVYADITMGGILRGPSNSPIAQQTKVGWVLLGNMKTYNCNAVLTDLDEISKFWEIEEITESPQHMTSEEEHCETLYENTTRRLVDGRYEVRIPMKANFEQELGASKSQAVAQFKQLEKRLGNNNQLSDSYRKFVEEYQALNHMKQCTMPREPSCFLPHHGVLRPDSTTTKLRVVFNASARTTTGHSLNQLMLCGPNLQQDLQSMILRWRFLQYVYTADIEKFYRQIRITEQDQHLQKIVWRNSQSESIQEYQLTTVTYGTKAAPFLAMRTVKQLIMDDGHKYPLAADILNHQLYVDDLLGGSNSIPEAQTTQKQLIDMLAGGGFNLRKWASNTPTLLEHLTTDLISQNMLDFKQAESNKTLGITWNPRTDQFTFKQSALSTKHDVTTKRTLLSELSKLYDPLGWLTPLTMKAKLIFQLAWTVTAKWDDPLPENIKQEWEEFKQDLHNIQNITIPRWAGNTRQNIELHGFSDASERAYGCVIYCKSMDEQGQQVINLVAGKAKLAPLKKPMSLPRLELCGALLLSRLMKKVKESINIQTINVATYGWTDSMVVMGWIQGEPTRWKTFVANRVVNITESMPQTCWRHVKSEDNPADCASRGSSPSQLLIHPLWWQGPEWLKTKNLPSAKKMETCEEERKQKQVCTTQIIRPLVESLLHKYCSMTRVIRVLSWVMRFINNSLNVNNAERTSYLRPTELQSALHLAINTVQSTSFIEEITQLRKDNKVKSTSKILKLNPVLDKEGLLRVGGRLEKSNLEHSRKHPIILPNKNKLTELLVDHAHKTTLHGGARLTITYLQQKYWIIGGMKTVKAYLSKCVKCHRHRSQQSSQVMADLPRPRVTPSRPFTHTGVDFTGQVEVKANKGRGIKTLRAYIAVFVCLCTKATHLELVSDLSTPAFLAALKRLCARRGTPKHLYSDNGTNFVGAARTLAKDRNEALKMYINEDFYNFIAENGIEWHFNAPSWPTAGGLWEAAVKSMKYHLKRVLGEQKLTFEEFSTLLTQIEACLNSRPLVAGTNDMEDLECLTPGHFLVGGPVLAPPLDTGIDSSLTARWRLTEKMFRDFWKEWSRTYLQSLQARSKWHYPTKNIEVGDIVLIQDDHIPPARWLLGKVIDTHPGSDGQVRVVTLKTKSSNSIKRPITKISRLPIDNETQDETSKPTITTHNPTKKQRIPRATKGKFRNYFTTALLFLFMCMTPVTPQFVNITSLDPGKLIYFDKIADMKIIQDEWKMVVFYNMSSYWQSLSNIEKYIHYLNSLCKREVAFQVIATQLQHELNELKHYNEVLTTEHGRRSKRGLIDGVGYVANSLFGVLDERFAEKYDKDIRKLQANENHLTNLYKRHTSIIEGEYNLLKRNEQIMTQQFAVINKHIKDSENRIAGEINNGLYITATALNANMIVSNLRRIQQLLLDLITDIRHGRIDTHLLKPDQFEAQLNVISGQIPANALSLPCTNSYECTRLMYKISRVHARLTEDFLIFEVKIPLIAAEQYELSRALPIYNIQGTKITRVTLTSEYLAVNLKKDLLILIQKEDMTSCVHSSEHQLLCNLNLPIYDIKTTNSICEAVIINNGAITSACRTVVSDCRDEWIQLHRRDTWVFACCQECTTRIFCTAGVTSQELRNTGIITLADGCMLRGENHVIHSHNNFHSEVQLNDDDMYIPESRINHFLTINSNNNYSYQPETHEEQLQTLKKEIDSIKNDQEKLNVEPNDDDIHHYTMYSFMAICFIVFCTWGALKIRRRQHHKRPNHQEELEMKNVTNQHSNDDKTRNENKPARDDESDDVDLNVVTSKVDKAT